MIPVTEKLKTWFLTPPPPDHRVAVRIEFDVGALSPGIVKSFSRLDLRKSTDTHAWTAKQTGDYYVTDSLTTTGDTPLAAILNWIEGGLQRCPGLVNWIQDMNCIDEMVYLTEPKFTMKCVKIEVMKPSPHDPDCLTIWEEPHIEGHGRTDKTVWSFTRYGQDDGKDVVLLRSEESSTDHPWPGARTGFSCGGEVFSSPQQRALFFALVGWIRKSFEEAVERDASGEQKMAFLYRPTDQKEEPERR